MSPRRPPPLPSSTVLARAVVRALVEGGITDVVIAPGSRNAPLSFAAWDAARAGHLRLHTRIDERTAGFLALGLTRNGCRAAVMCTSGTAVLNLHPAIREASHAGVRLVAVTADRPWRLHGTSANQTTMQAHAFGDMCDVIEMDRPTPMLAEHLTVTGPVHVNVLLEEPLVPEDRWRPRITVKPPLSWLSTPTYTELPLGPRTVVVAGDDSGPAARRLAEAAGWPLLAEPTSGSRTGDHALRCYRLLLDDDLGRRIERVVVYGRPTLSRSITRLLGRDDVEVLSVAAPGFPLRRPFRCTPLEGGLDVEGVDDPTWLGEWREADAVVGRALDGLLAGRDLTPYDVAAAVHAALPPGGLLVVGASNPIRDLDLMMRPTPVGERRKVIANRGLSGIDGTVSTAIGAALARPEGERNLALLGDVTFLHDANGLILGPDEPRPDLTIVVVNDDGGSIFATLEQGAPEHAASFERLFATPHHVDLGALCAATRTPHLRVTSRVELEQALASPNGGIEVIEAVVRRDDRRELDAAIRGLVAPTAG